MKFILLPITLIFVSHVEAHELVSLRAERSTKGAEEQMTVTFKDDQAIFSQNSNFLSGAQPTVELGERMAPINEKMRADREELRRISQRVPDAAAAANAGPNAIRITVGKNEFDPDSQFGKIAVALLVKIRDEGGWKSKKSARVTLGSSDPRFQATAHIGSQDVKIRCEPDAQALRCLVPGFGTAYLQKKD